MAQIYRTLLAALIGGCLAASGALGAAFPFQTTFDNGQNVNVLASDNATITLTGGGWGSDSANNTSIQSMTTNFADSSSWAMDPTPGTSQITINLGAPREIQSINTYVPFNGAAYYGFNTVLVETSNNGVTGWTPQANTVVNSGTASDINLTAPVDAQYLRITPLTPNGSFAGHEGTANGGGRLILDSLRVIAPSGSLTDTTGNLNLVAGSGGIHGGVTMTLSTGAKAISITDTNATTFINEGLNPIQRDVLYNIQNGATVTYHFGQSMQFNEIGIFHAPGGTPDNKAGFTVETSTDGVTYHTVLNQPEGTTTNTFPLSTMDYYALTPSMGSYVRFTYLGTSSADRISDIQLFGGVPTPEPSSIVMSGVAAACGLAVCWRRRRRA